MPRAPSEKSQSPAMSSSSLPKKKHVCPTCERAFTTSGHLARHSRVHTGERNHKCPFPGCETRCSRQDNLQQHYRIHLSPGSRRNSARSAISRVLNTPTQPKKEESPPPALEPARVYASHSPPPDSPPPLAHATLSATTTNGSYYDTTSNGNSGYSYVHSNPTPSPPFSSHSLQHHQTQQQQQQQLSPIQSPHALAHQPSLSHQSSQHLSQHSLPPPPQLTHSHSHYETSSRHSIAHISPPSPDSSSGPPTPYQAYSQDGYARYDSPPPVLAPLRGVERGYYYGGNNAEWAPRGKGMVQ